MRALLPILVAALAVPAFAQPTGAVPPRIGVGLEVVSAFYPQDVVPDGPSVGLRVRGALPVTADVSLAASLGGGAHVFEGGDEATFVLNPQASVILTLPGDAGTRVRYLLGGLGAFVPFSGGGGGAAVHLGGGLAFPLSESSAFVEVDPSLVIGEEASVVVLAVRAGVIF